MTTKRVSAAELRDLGLFVRDSIPDDATISANAVRVHYGELVDMGKGNYECLVTISYLEPWSCEGIRTAAAVSVALH